MTFKEFDSYTDEMIRKIKVMRDTKGREYAGTQDRFTNFNDGAVSAGIDRKQVWLVLFDKHVRSIYNFIREGKVYSEPIDGRIVDACTYLLLLGGMIQEDVSGPKSEDDDEKSIKDETVKCNDYSSGYLRLYTHWCKSCGIHIEGPASRSELVVVICDKCKNIAIALTGCLYCAGYGYTYPILETDGTSRAVPCLYCNGSCPTCRGKGSIRVSDSVVSPCPACTGRGTKS